jgi:hypothetical protein
MSDKEELARQIKELEEEMKRTAQELAKSKENVERVGYIYLTVSPINICIYICLCIYKCLYHVYR